MTDANGNPVQGAVVGFTIVPGPTGAGATFLGGGPAGAVTNSSGVATAPPLLAGAMPGRFTVTASTDGVSSVAVFSLDNHAYAMALTVMADADPVATVNARFRNALRARVVDGGGQPVEGASVMFAVAPASSGAGASFVGGAAQATELTGVDGVATTPALLANKVAGAYTVDGDGRGCAAGRILTQERRGESRVDRSRRGGRILHDRRHALPRAAGRDRHRQGREPGRESKGRVRGAEDWG